MSREISIRNFGVWFGMVLSLGVLGLGSPAIAARRNAPDRFPPNPLEIQAPDPLLPNPKAPLSGSEAEALGVALDGLNLEALAQLRAGDRAQAFETWYRELRLRRALGPMAEVEALGRVGSYAWGENNAPVVRVITRRLEQIQATAQTQNPPDWGVLRQLGAAYQQLRTPEQAIAIYEQLLTHARTQEDRASELETLQTMGQLYLGWLNYPKAGAIYQELLTDAQARGDRNSQITLYQQLAYIYDRQQQVQPGIDARLALVELYTQANRLREVPQLKLAIAANYETLGELQKAATQYEEAFTLAQTLQQLDDAAIALERLGQLYRQEQQLEAALEVYKILLLVNSQAYDVYGMMNTYDRMAQISLSRQDYPQALASYRRALALAEQLKIRRNHFIRQIEQIDRQMNPTPPPTTPDPL
ncbi:tetratricopeptide repeat protein [Kamptonema cortianum]|uniref:Tetratricopeptide repeat protein n=1 Tax=Geitlerinema calcuttense NRMC-F 0142 TaxID=2922238 RepID=A0ABT7M031_9CYAN|nr:tetratricopeptide repeat protein [Geitlerinema calcuttense]MDK3160124.1 tetratricopeptide repeat protein [Kamptonema cortianum]MDL5057627.1 tetratricopeptide repeat protein [Geitlerinema calcuttense NRMC-F 0142]